MSFLHVIVKQPPRAELCLTPRNLTRLIAFAVMKLYMCPEIVSGRERFATVRNVTLDNTDQHHTPFAAAA